MKIKHTKMFCMLMGGNPNSLISNSNKVGTFFKSGKIVTSLANIFTSQYHFWTSIFYLQKDIVLNVANNFAETYVIWPSLKKCLFAMLLPGSRRFFLEIDHNIMTSSYHQ